jgi:hypothetical protein
MNKFRYGILTTIFLLLISSNVGALTSEEKQRMLRMQQTIDEMTLRNAELLKENQRLEKQVLESLKAERTGGKFVAGCDTNEAKEIVVFASPEYTASKVFLAWVKSNDAQCTKDQLSWIGSNALSWSRASFKSRN